MLFTHPSDDRNWLEEGVVDEIKQRFDVPVAHLVVEGWSTDRHRPVAIVP